VLRPLQSRVDSDVAGVRAQFVSPWREAGRSRATRRNTDEGANEPQRLDATLCTGTQVFTKAKESTETGLGAMVRQIS